MPIHTGKQPQRKLADRLTSTAMLRRSLVLNCHTHTEYSRHAFFNELNILWPSSGVSLHILNRAGKTSVLKYLGGIENWVVPNLPSDVRRRSGVHIGCSDHTVDTIRATYQAKHLDTESPSSVRAPP